MSDAFTIERETRAGGGRYVVRLPEGREAEMTWQDSEAGVIVADHTFVPPEHRGKGIAEALVARAVADARQAGIRIHPTCSYVVAQFRRHPEWTDLKA